MQAIAASRYGNNEVLRLADLPDLTLGPDSILVSPKAVGVNPVDCKVMRGYQDGAVPSHSPRVGMWPG